MQKDLNKKIAIILDEVKEKSAIFLKEKDYRLSIMLFEDNILYSSHSEFDDILLTIPFLKYVEDKRYIYRGTIIDELESEKWESFDRNIFDYFIIDTEELENIDEESLKLLLKLRR
jgi:hypothetical protein